MAGKINMPSDTSTTPTRKSNGSATGGAHVRQFGSFSEASSFLWSIADLLRGDYKQYDYGKVILPFTVLRRLVVSLPHETVISPSPSGRQERMWNRMCRLDPRHGLMALSETCSAAHPGCFPAPNFTSWWRSVRRERSSLPAAVVEERRKGGHQGRHIGHGSSDNHFIVWTNKGWMDPWSNKWHWPPKASYRCKPARTITNRLDTL